jgi:phospholipase/carboxylesterase
MQVRQTRLGPLDARVVGEDGAEGGPVVVLLHGFGAPGTDLVPLAQYLAAPPGTRFVFPQAPIDLGPTFAGGRAWWMIDMLALQQAMALGTFRDLAETVPDGLTEAREQLAETLDAVDAELAPRALALGGFSQGAMLATDYALRSDRKLACMVLFSGTVIARPEWAPLMAKRAGIEVAQSHGQMDPILPYAGAEQLREMMEGAGWKVRFVSFPGQHEIPPRALEAAGDVLKSHLAG